MKIIDGKSIAKELRQEIAEEISQLKIKTDIVPGLAVFLIGDHPASKLYVRNKIKACKEVGIKFFEFYLPSDTSEKDLLEKIEEANDNPNIHGILVQLPLPDYIDSVNIINAIDPNKDVDGFTVSNVGKLVTQQDCFVPCTPQGCLILIKTIITDLKGLNALVIGRSNIVGKPMFHVLLQENTTVTLANSYTKDLQSLCLNADIIVSAVGVPKIIKGEWIKPGAIVIDVGINYIDDRNIVGDVEFDQAITRAKAISPVPGGVGPMTVTCLLKNTLKATINASMK
jgi:methylenetetrahydrofolate dehydrogenase (NADP+) / methenyltetrahydrofolate cyclohydrolase